MSTRGSMRCVDSYIAICRDVVPYMLYTLIRGQSCHIYSIDMLRDVVSCMFYPYVNRKADNACTAISLQSKMNPLHLAARSNRVEIVKLLLEAGADHTVKLPSKYYSTSQQTALSCTDNKEIKARVLLHRRSCPEHIHHRRSSTSSLLSVPLSTLLNPDPDPNRNTASVSGTDQKCGAR